MLRLVGIMIFCHKKVEYLVNKINKFNQMIIIMKVKNLLLNSMINWGVKK